MALCATWAQVGELITPGWVAWLRVSGLRPETPSDPRAVTEDVSRLHHKVYYRTIQVWQMPLTSR